MELTTEENPKKKITCSLIQQVFVECDCILESSTCIWNVVMGIWEEKSMIYVACPPVSPSL